MSETNAVASASDYQSREIARLSAEAAKWRHQLRAATKLIAERDAKLSDLQKAHDAVATERDALQGKVATAPGEWQAKYEEAQKAILERDHRDAFAAVKDQLHEKVDVKKLWAEAGYEPTGDVPDAAKIDEWVGKARAAAPYLFRSDPEGSTQPTSQPGGLRPGPGAGRGAPDTTTASLRVRAADLGDPEYMRINQKTIAAASAEGRLVVLD